MNKTISLLFAIFICAVFLGLAIAATWAFNTIVNPPKIPLLEDYTYRYEEYVHDMNDYVNTWKKVGDVTDALVPGQAISINSSSILGGDYNNIMTPSSGFKGILAFYWLVFFVSLISIFVISRWKKLRRPHVIRNLEREIDYRELDRYGRNYQKRQTFGRPSREEYRRRRSGRSRFQDEEDYRRRR